MRALLDRELRNSAASLAIHFGFAEVGGSMSEEVATVPGLQRLARALAQSLRSLRDEHKIGGEIENGLVAPSTKPSICGGKGT